MKLTWVLLTLAVFVYAQDDEPDLKCSLNGNTELINFSGQKALLPLPCRVHMASIYVKVAKNMQTLYGLKYFTVDVLAQSNLIPYHGRHYTNNVTIEIKGYDLNTLELSVSGIYKVNSSRVREVWQRDLEESEVWHAATTIDGSIIMADYDKKLNRARLRLTEGSRRIMEISFRPFNESDHIHQHQIPGLYITIKENSVRRDKDRKFPKSMCSNRNDLRTFEEILGSNPYKGILENEHQLMLFTALQQNETQPCPECRDLLAAFQSCTGTSNTMLAATRDCFPYSGTHVVHCLHNRLNVVPVKALEECFRYKCQTDSDAEAWLNNVTTYCPLP